MSLKKEIFEKIPKEFHEEPHFLALLDYLKQNEIESKSHLIDFLEQETALVERWIDDNRHSNNVNVKSIRDRAMHLDGLHKSIKLTKEFLL